LSIPFPFFSKERERKGGDLAVGRPIWSAGEKPADLAFVSEGLSLTNRFS
jgi:hypothetical protein